MMRPQTVLHSEPDEPGEFAEASAFGVTGTVVALAAAVVVTGGGEVATLTATTPVVCTSAPVNPPCSTNSCPDESDTAIARFG